jgi:hypothetical protein
VPFFSAANHRYAELLLTVAWEEFLAVCCFSNPDGSAAEFASSGHRISGDIGSDSRHLMPVVEERWAGVSGRVGGWVVGGGGG